MNKEQYRVKLIHDCYNAITTNRDLVAFSERFYKLAEIRADKILKAHPWPEEEIVFTSGASITLSEDKKPEMTAKELVERLEKQCLVPTAIYSWNLAAIKKEAGL